MNDPLGLIQTFIPEIGRWRYFQEDNILVKMETLFKVFVKD